MGAAILVVSSGCIGRSVLTPLTARDPSNPVVGETCTKPVSGTTTCGVGVCAGNTGSLACVDNVVIDTCDPFLGAAVSDVTCDGVDDDCDPLTPDGAADPRLGTPCDGPDADGCPDDVYDACSHGALVCDAAGTGTDLCGEVQTLDTFDQHTCAVLGNGSAKCWGVNQYGYLGLGDTLSRGDDLGEMGDALPVVDLGSGRFALSVAVGAQHGCAILDDTTLKCWGRNLSGRLGLGDTDNRGDAPGEMGDNLPAIDLGAGRRAVALSPLALSMCVLLDNASVKCWGRNANGEAGLGDTNDRGDEPGEMGDNLPAIDLGTGRTALQVSSGEFHSCALLDDHTVKCWGASVSGALGLGDTEVRGDNPGEMGDNLPVVDLGTERTAIAISAGRVHNCAILDNGALKCWGRNDSGELGLGDTTSRGALPNDMGDNLPEIDLGTGRTAIAVAAGNSTCAILDNQALKCWGRNSSGELGLGDVEHRGDEPGEMGDNLPVVDLGPGRTAREVVVGLSHTCARLDNDTIKCWGFNDQGQLGLEDTASRGDASGEMGDNLPAVDLGDL
ncbi:MAG: hypothetical protein R3C68_02155 [Myxococcota bacterium]